jgi:hypothetical protein
VRIFGDETDSKKNDSKSAEPSQFNNPTVRKIFGAQSVDYSSNEDVLTLNKHNMVDLDTIFD